VRTWALRIRGLLLREQETDENLLTRLRVNVLLKLEQRLRLILRQPDSLQIARTERDGQVTQSIESQNKQIYSKDKRKLKPLLRVIDVFKIQFETKTNRNQQVLLCKIYLEKLIDLTNNNLVNHLLNPFNIIIKTIITVWGP